jgi:hypothetical protein
MEYVRAQDLGQWPAGDVLDGDGALLVGAGGFEPPSSSGESVVNWPLPTSL